MRFVSLAAAAFILIAGSPVLSAQKTKLAAAPNPRGAEITISITATCIGANKHTESWKKLKGERSNAPCGLDVTSEDRLSITIESVTRYKVLRDDPVSGYLELEEVSEQTTYHGDGGGSESRSEFHTDDCSMEPEGSKEKTFAYRSNGTWTYTVKNGTIHNTTIPFIAWREGVCRLSMDSNFFEVGDIEPLGQNKVEIEACEGLKESTDNAVGGTAPCVYSVTALGVRDDSFTKQLTARFQPMSKSFSTSSRAKYFYRSKEGKLTENGIDDDSGMIDVSYKVDFQAK